MKKFINRIFVLSISFLLILQVGQFKKVVHASDIFIPYSVFDTQDWGGGLEIIGYTGVGGDVIIPNSMHGKNVFSVGEHAFANKNLTSITIPVGVRKIGGGAFDNNQLTSIVLPDSITYLGSNAFRDNLITSATLPSNLTEIPAGVFNRNMLTSIIIPSSVTTIWSQSFSNNNIEELNLPEGVISIGHSAFAGNNISSLYLPDSLEELEDYAFIENKISTLFLPNKLTEINEGVFSDNEITTIFAWPDNLKTIGSYAFSDNKFTSLTIPNSIESIGEYAFGNNTNLSSIKLSKNLLSISESAFLNTNLSEIIIYPKVHTIGPGSDVFPSSLAKIKGLSDSVAETYANANSILFEPFTIISNLTFLSTPHKTDYKKNDTLDLSGLELEARYHDGYEEIVLDDYLTINGYDFTGNNFGKQTLELKYFDKSITHDVYYNRFNDIPSSHSFYDYITALSNEGIIKGYDDTFRPNNPLTRAQAAKMIVLSAGIDTSGASSNFSDVKASSSSYEFISAAFEAGIIKGYDDGTFKPNALVTRAQIAKMVSVAFNLSKVGNPPKFSDVEALSSANTREYIYTLSSLEIVKGYDDGTYRPRNNVTRGQFSKIVSIARTK